MQTEIYIRLLDEPASRPTQAEMLGANRYKVLPIANYGTADELWEFIPGTIVECKEQYSSNLEKSILVAVKKVEL